MSTLRLTTIANQTGSSSVPSDTVISGSAKAWVNFNGTGTVAIRASFNVSSITDGGAGNYTINFTNSLVDANYSPIAVSGYLSSGDSGHVSPTLRSLTTGSFQIYNYNDGDALVDSDIVCVSIFR